MSRKNRKGGRQADREEERGEIVDTLKPPAGAPVAADAPMPSDDSPTVIIEQEVEHVSVVLNGGRRVMDSATIPIQWFFSKELIEKQPQWVVVVDNSEQDVKDDNRTTGYRYVFRVKDSVQFLQMHRAGIHRLTILVFGKTEEQFSPLRLEHRESNGEYRASIPFFSTQVGFAGGFSEKQAFLAATVVEINVPEEMFSALPETGYGRMWWDYVNSRRWYKQRPVDQCEFRKRKLWIIFGQRWVVDFVVFGVLLSLARVLVSAIVLLMWLGVLFFGLRPANLREVLQYAWSLGDPEHMQLLYFAKMDSRTRYRVWSSSVDSSSYLWPSSTLKMMPFAPWEAVWFVSPVAIAVHLWRHCYSLSSGETVGLFLIGLVLISVAAGLILERFVLPILNRSESRRLKKQQREEDEKRWKKERKKAEEDAKLEKEAREKAAYQRWLAKNAALEARPSAVDLTKVEVYGGNMDRLAGKARIWFWSAKRKACKPYQS